MKDSAFKALTVFTFIVVLAAVVGIRLLIVGAHTECFWAQDVGTCMAVADIRDR